MYQIAVCDDEPAVCNMVAEEIKKWNQDIKVFFLDIDMQGMNGIETGRQIRERDRETKIIYLTSYRDYVIGAFKVHAFQYLLKPITPMHLIQILEEIFQYVKKTDKIKLLDFHTNEGVVCIFQIMDN